MATRVQVLKEGERRRKAALSFVRRRSLKGITPTVAEIADKIGVTPTAAHKIVRRLAEDGYLTTAPLQARSIVLTSPAPDGWTRP